MLLLRPPQDTKYTPNGETEFTFALSLSQGSKVRSAFCNIKLATTRYITLNVLFPSIADIVLSEINLLP